MRPDLALRNTTHGLCRKYPAEYRTWKDMRARCGNSKNTNYPDYGGRGIVVCERWLEFQNFFKDMGERPEGQTLDRLDPNGPYAPWNCRWATAKQQANNRRTSHRLTIDGVTLTLQEWARHYGIGPSKVRYRLSHGWGPKEAFSLADYRR